MKKILAFVLIFCSQFLFAQITFEKTYGNNSDYESGYSLVIALDSGYVFTGTNHNFPPGTGSAYIMKVNQLGDTVFETSFPIFSSGYSVQATFDGGYIVDALYDSVPHSNYPSRYLIKTDAVGDTEWTRIYYEGGNQVIQTPDSGFLLAGSYILKTNSSGDSLWAKDYGTPLSSFFVSVDLTPDTGFILTGSRIVSNLVDIVLAKLNSSGDTMWTKYFDGGSSDYGKAVKTLNDGNYIIASTSHDTSTFQNVIWIIKADSSGDSIWSKKINGIDSYEVGDISPTRDGGFIITGNTYNYATDEGDLLLIKIDSIGNVQWSRTYSHNLDDDGRTVKQTFDGGFIVVGNTDNIVNDGIWDIYLIKTDSLGNVDSTLTTNIPQSAIPNPQSEILLTPNPTTSLLTLRAGENKIESITLYNMLGEEMLRAVPLRTTNSQLRTINVSALPSGIYIVQATSGEKVWRGKVIKQ